MNKRQKILVYSCSGASSAAQMANWIAIQLDRRGVGEMSCIAGVGGGVKPLVVKAQSADVIIAVDGCPLNCVEWCLKRENVKSSIHYDLAKLGAAKTPHKDFDPAQARDILETIIIDLNGKGIGLNAEQSP